MFFCCTALFTGVGFRTIPDHVAETPGIGFHIH